jgi:hypothetical protein
MHRLLVPKVWAALKGLPLPPPINSQRLVQGLEPVSVHSRMHLLLVPKVWAALKGLPLPPPANLEHKGHRASVKLPP